MRTNEDRAERADIAVSAYIDQDSTMYEREAELTQLTDLLCDLMHWARSECVDFNHALQNAQMHYREECEQ